MSILTDKFLRETVHFRKAESLFYGVVDSSTLDYIRQLIQPYENKLKQSKDIQAISQILMIDFPESNLEIRRDGFAESNKQKKGLLPGFSEKNAFIKGVLESIIELLISLAIEVSRGYYSNQVLPWDVREVISQDEELSQLFPGDPQNLPVQISANGQTFEHQMSRNLAAGIMDFYYFLRQDGQPVSPPIIFIGRGQLRDDFNRGYTDNGQLFEETRGENGPFIMTFRNSGSIRFDSLEYLQGMQTAAQWSGIDIHSHVSDLHQFDPQSNAWIRLAFQ